MEIKVLLIGTDEQVQNMSRVVKSSDISIVGTVKNEAMVLDEIGRKLPDIVMICYEMGSMVIRICQQIYLLRPRSVIVLLTDNLTPEILQKSIQAGVHYFLPYTSTSDKIVPQIKAVHTKESTRLLAMENTSNVARKSCVIMVLGTKGGIGKTTFAVNLAIKLTKLKRKVALLDFDMQFGDASTYLGIESKDTLAELLQEQAYPTIDIIRKYITMHKSGVNLLCAPGSPEFADGISAPQIDKVISTLRTYYDYIILDTTSSFNEINLTCIDVSNIIMFVSGVDISSLKNTKKGLSLLESLQAKEKVKIIINKEAQLGINIADIEKTLGYPVFFSIPYDFKISMTALNKGVPFAMEYSSNPLNKGYEMLASTIDGKSYDKTSESNTKLKFLDNIKNIWRRK